MRFGVKVITGSILALLLGVLLASPLLYTNIVMAPGAVGPEPLFGVEVTYAYIEQINGTFMPNGTFVPDSHNPNETMKPGIPVVNYFVAFNSTRLSAEVYPCDAIFEVYLIKFYSDNGFVGNLGMWEGIIYNSDLVRLPRSENETDEGIIYNGNLTEPKFFPWFVPKISGDEFFGDYRPFAGGGSYGKWDVGESRGHGMSGVNLDWGSTFGEPETMFVSVSLLGWIAVKGNSTDTVFLGAAEVVAEVQLEKFGDGFLYNTIIPEDELSQIDPLNPYGKLFDMS